MPESDVFCKKAEDAAEMVRTHNPEAAHLINSVSPQDRADFAAKMLEINNAQREQCPSLPAFEIKTDKDASGKPVLLDIIVKGDKDAPETVYHSDLSRNPDGSTIYTSSDINPVTGKLQSEIQYSHGDTTENTECKYDSTGKLVSADTTQRTKISPTEEHLTVHGGGRDIDSVVLLPDNYDPTKKYPVIVAVHNFNGNAPGFGQVINAEKMQKEGAIVIIPQADGAEWQSLGLTVLYDKKGDNKQNVDDVTGILKTLTTAQTMYGIDKADINFLGFSQGAGVAVEAARRLDQEHPGAVKRVFLSAGTITNTDRKSIALPGTEIVHYEPGSNGIQKVGNLLSDSPEEKEFMESVIKAKDCTKSDESNINGVNSREYTCKDSQKIRRIYEADGEHSWPGQAQSFDSAAFGAGSTSHVKFTDSILKEIREGLVKRKLESN